MTPDALPPAEPIRPPGWYRVERGPHGSTWTWLAPPETLSYNVPGDPLTLVCIDHDAEEVPLW